ncbi:hypothetical protein [Vulcanisaeta distributa]|uniref:Uncharacterized protein n=1 Tax=Vulcanisaeta distributa (strain DSM 14429 / JCM 11212 / NBRC 100878 / IC-017) TaxID=572478 RepID=E1QSM9_VULDI|nr:hypothetical protein [Vulcanisaeta distributa]ADN49546.1 hypothetical protein Vdis_0133 [Vulcanisaeta distributa DSM 14429]
MRWEALAFYIEPRELLFCGKAVVGVADVDMDDCAIAVSSIKHAVISVEDLHGLTDLIRQGIKPLTAYPSHYMALVTHLLGRVGIPRYAFKVVNADPHITPFKAVGAEGIIRNIAYLHGVLNIVARNWVRMGRPKASYAIHAMLRASGYNADRDLANRYRGSIPCRVKLY